MSIHNINTSVTFTWYILPTGSPPVKSDFDIVRQLPNTNTLYSDDGIETYVPPTATERGKVTYILPLVRVGRHEVTLSVGGSATHIVNAKRVIFCVVAPDYVINGASIANNVVSTTQGPEIIPPPYIPPFNESLPDAVYSGNSKPSQLFNTFGIFIRPDTGLKTFLTRTGIVTNQHVMSVAWDLDSTAQSGQRNMSNDGKSGTDVTYALGVSPDIGRHVYFCFDEIPNPTFDYNVSEFVGTTAWNISTFSTSSPHATLDASPTVEEAVGIAWSDDGTKCYLVDRATERISEWDAGTPYQLETLVYNGVFFDFSSQGSTLRSIHFNVDGTSFYMVGASTVVYQFNLTVPWDLSTTTYSGDSFNCSPTCSDIVNIYVKPDETSFYVQDFTATRAYQFNM